ncbi:hypothetical protein HDU76_009525, partial [Blyttiomyces sp. JEL0837]
MMTSWQQFSYLLMALPILATVKVILNYILSSRFTPSLLTPMKGSHVLITGASKGLGKGIAIELAKAGVHVTLVARGTDIDSKGKSSLDYAVEEVKEVAVKAKMGEVKVRSLAVDLSDEKDVVDKFRGLYVECNGRRPDWIIANAGGADPGFVADQLTDIGVNVVRAVVRLAKEFPGPEG